ncbi:MAG: PEP-CTERM/exosortase system-associated acyltransferase [Methylomonas sp.]|nr:MAG: PEP-CTERM/exosortase system-associated acyltransferase [Methylomonas sp.]PPD26634.1 MAG: PEP-CTERM/exosortase system-associated acyltransferase [Methylomonas sp.]PPD38422.1 MAG: PEP-CTERM/exosortase system-associated acyltransferase [Methylomonas sp.]PPD40422.1 MAG: PEP-CTERM/exosortase system-associated acyltransferase [Methylomonas sp.]PPD53222.1 MAG: PEP-CTERM/exosortase system-associated acyltransferase [Methylomonas sp.]
MEKRFFDSNFEVVLADTFESKLINYNIRYQVYCDEMGFEDKDVFPDEIEFDEWDKNSVHFLVRHKSSENWLGGLRLVHSNANSGEFPFEEWSVPDQQIADSQRNNAVEVSRLCVIKNARRFTAKRFAPYGLPDHEVNENGNVKSIFNHKNQSRSLMWGLLGAAARYSVDHDIRSWYFIVTPALAGLLRINKFEMTQIGGACEHRGERFPYRLDVIKFLENALWLDDYKADYLLHSKIASRGEKARIRDVVESLAG